MEHLVSFNLQETSYKCTKIIRPIFVSLLYAANASSLEIVTAQLSQARNFFVHENPYRLSLCSPFSGPEKFTFGQRCISPHWHYRLILGRPSCRRITNGRNCLGHFCSNGKASCRDVGHNSTYSNCSGAFTVP